MITAVIYDLDDTIIDSKKHLGPGVISSYTENKKYLNNVNLETFLLANRKALESLLFERSKKNTILSQIGILIWFRTLENLGIQANPFLIRKLYNSLQKYTLSNINLKKNILKVLNYLNFHNYKIAVLSNGSFVEKANKLDRVGISEKIDLLFSSDLAGWDKPHHRPFEMILELLNVKNSEVFYIGDSLAEDINGAQKMGIKSFLYIEHEYQNIPENVQVMNDHIDIIKLLEEINGIQPPKL